MRSIQRRFEGLQEKHPNLSTYIIFAKAVRGQRFTRPIMTKWFKKLVDKNDYDPKDRNTLIRELVRIADESESGV